MPKKENKVLETWLRENAWNLIVTIGLVVSTFTLLNYRVAAVEKRQAEYPSYDYFDLKFRTIDDHLKQIDIKLEANISQK